MLFDASTKASEVRLIGDSGGTILRALDGARLLTMLPGAPPVTLHGLTLHGQLAVNAGWLKIEGCALQDCQSSSDGGALMMTGGSVHARSTTFARNTAVGNGGAISIDGGGDALLHDCLVKGNVAGDDGGGIHVRNGLVVLSAGTTLKGNFAANRGDSIFVLGGQVDYKLPCPLGHMVSPEPGHIDRPNHVSIPTS